MTKQEEAINAVIGRHSRNQVRLVNGENVELFNVVGHKSKAVVVERDGSTRAS